ncbi:MAG: hypothetical protein PW734_01360, partial [Verrucomicrobium sp.]|nr:hypothetical protein [Verrucomicrobium sp.]
MARMLDTFLGFIEGGWTPEMERELLLPRHALHAAALRFWWQGKRLEFRGAVAGGYAGVFGGAVRAGGGGVTGFLMPSGAEVVEALPAIGSLVVIEGLLSVDNALAVAALAKRLPVAQRKHALTLGWAGRICSDLWR